MNSKSQYIESAESLFVYHLKSIADITKEIKVSDRTLGKWRLAYDWDFKRKQYLKSKQNFHEELYEFSRKIMKEIEQEIAEGKEISERRFSNFIKMLPSIVKVKEYEDLVAKKQKEGKKGLTPEIIREIERDILGIKHRD